MTGGWVSRGFGLAVTLLCAAVAWVGASELTLAPIFGEHMVLQRDQPLVIWGTATPGAPVVVNFAGQQATAAADATGAWQVTLAAKPASGPFRLEAQSGTASVALGDLMLGDVWLASGQSNMVLALGASSEWPSVRSAGTMPAIRICKLPGTGALAPSETYVRAVPWDVLDSARANAFSAVAYHFAVTIQPVVGATVGVIEGASGGTMAEQWTPEAALRAADPQSTSSTFAARDKALARIAAEPQAKIGTTEAGASALYNGTIHPLRRLKFAGVLWYQGEANSRSKDDYRPRLTTLIRSWRELFAEPDLPWIIVQLPQFGLPKDDGWMRVQEAQRLVAHDLGLPLVVTIDQGSATTIHPPNKAVVGRRVGLAAQQHVYHQAVSGTSPLPTSLTYSAGTAVIGFSDELKVSGATANGFELAGVDGAFVPATAQVAWHTVTLTAPGVASPAAVRYLWVHYSDAVTLYGPTGLPVPPFRFGADAPQAQP
jgi:sialate O-acetylesterase